MGLQHTFPNIPCGSKYFYLCLLSNIGSGGSMKQRLKSMVRPMIHNIVVANEKRSYGAIDVDSPDIANDAIIRILDAGQPASVGKMGSVELDMVRAYLSKIPTESQKWKHRMNRLNVCPGIFPEETYLVKEYCEAFLNALTDLDILGVWFNAEESKVAHKYCTKALIANYHGVEPFDVYNPWTRHLEGKNVLVIHPFKDSIKTQYAKRELVWGERKILPDFNLMQIKMPLSKAIVSSKYETWKEQLDDLKGQMDGFDYDVALVGAGGYSLLLTQFAKANGKIGIHLGGSTQVLFGVYGSRWLSDPNACKLFNEHWTRPLPEETPPPERFAEVRGDVCYW